MRLVCGARVQKLGRFIDDHIVNSTLHRAKEVMVKVRDMYRLMYHQVDHFTGNRVVMGNDPANGLIGFRPKGRIVTNNLDGSVIV
jgi:hypothetical protein